MLFPIHSSVGILGYAVVTLLLRYLVLSAFSVILIFLCMLVRPIFAYAGGVLLIGANYLLANAPCADANHPLRILNLYYMSEPRELFLSLRCFHFHDTAVPFFSFLLPFYLAVFVLFAILCFPIFYTFGSDGHRRRSADLPKKFRK